MLLTALPRLAIVLLFCFAGSAACSPRRHATPDPAAHEAGHRPGVEESAGTGSASLPHGCVSPTRAAATGRSPRCVVSFGRAPAAVAVTPDGALAIVSSFEATTAAWRLPGATFVVGFEGPPEEEPAEHGDHEDEPRVIAPSADGMAALFAIGSRIVRYDIVSGRPGAHVEGPGGMIDDLAWSGRGTRVLLATAGDGQAHLFDLGDGRVLRTLRVAGRAVKVALSADESRAAVGTVLGTIGIVDLRAEAPPRVLTPSTQEVAGLVFAADRLVVAGRDGELRVFAAATGKQLLHANAAAPLVSLAVSPDRRLAATADDQHRVRLFRLSDGTMIETLQWHRASIAALAWGVGPTLLVADNDGELALWDVSAPAEREALDSGRD